MDHHVELSVRQIGLGPPEIRRELLPDRLLDDPRTREAEECPRLGHHDVGEGSEAGKDSPGGGMGEDDHERQTLFGQKLQGDDGLRHLHQGQDALLHARASGRGDAHERHVVLHGSGDQTHEALAHH